MDDDMIGTQPPSPGLNPPSNDPITRDDDEEISVRDCSNSQKYKPNHKNQDGGEEIMSQNYQDEREETSLDAKSNDEEEDASQESLSNDAIAQSQETQQEEMHESAEHETVSEQETLNETIRGDGFEYQEHGEAVLDDIQYAQHEDIHTNIYGIHESQNTDRSDVFNDQGDFQQHASDEQQEEDPNITSRNMQCSSNFGTAYAEQGDSEMNYSNRPYEDASTLFVSEDKSPSPPVAPRRESFANMISSARLSNPSRKLAPLSIGARIRNKQKQVQDRKKAASREIAFSPFHAPLGNETYPGGMLPRSSSFAGTPTVDEDEQADQKAVMEFQKQKRHYEDLKKKNNGKLSFRHDIEWMKIQGAEDARKKKRRRDIEKSLENEDGEPNLFPEIYRTANDESENESDDASDNASDDHIGGSRKRQEPRNQIKHVSMQDAEFQSMRVALEADGDLPRKKRKVQPTGDNSHLPGPSGRDKRPQFKPKKAPKTKTATKKVTQSGGGRRRTAKNKREVESAVRQATSLFNANVFQQQAGVGANAQPTFRSRVKADALKELIASVPIEDQKKAKSDINILLAATKDFDGRGAVKSDGAGLWLVKGMKTALKNYQVLGTAFMRRRENATEEPRGGLLADQMGLGKTLMMLGNIVNGQPVKGSKHPRTTLLVASPALLSQWKSEIEQHTSYKFKVLRYGTGMRIDSNHALEILGAHDIVLTTYTEIMRSYPKNEPPIDRQTAEQKIAWWKDVYENERGVLHRMMFLRIVLDEAQVIKNHLGRTSIACRALMAHHKWALSGTPILNSLTELYPYFKFLGVPHTGSFKIFKHNYCDTGNKENTERLLVRLSQFMLRRTHADEMFGAPILKLPQADQITYWCDFNPVERCIYDIVRARFAMRINMWSKKGELEKSYSNTLVMLLRLRQLAAHVLMLHFVIRDLFEREDIELLKTVVEELAAKSSSKHGDAIRVIRKQLEEFATNQKEKRSGTTAAGSARAAGRDENEEDSDTAAEEEELDAVDCDELMTEPTEQHTGGRGSSGGKFGKNYNFKPFLQSLRNGESWEKAKKKATCSHCRAQPRIPYMMSCRHLICEECLTSADLKAAEEGKDQAACQTCGMTPIYKHRCEPEDDDIPENVAQGTRSNARKKKRKERNRLDREDITDDWLASVGDDVLPSAKTIAVKAQIINWIGENPDVKIIVYTQFLAMIRILVRICQKEGWLVEKYHGKMSFSARDKAIHSFAKNPNIKIMLASLRCGGLGLNLTMASKVIIIDPWWNSASEQQAFCRVFRIGQKEETFMSRLCVRNTVDEHLIEMQQRKQGEIDSVMEDDGEKVKKMGIRDLMRLFGNLEEDSDGRPFIMVDNPDPRGGFRADRDDEGYADEL